MTSPVLALACAVMAAYLVIANQTLGGTALLDAVTLRSTLDRAHIHVVVPATEPTDQQTPATGTASEMAQLRLQAALQRFNAAGVHATGEIGAADPMQAARDAIAKDNYTGLIISTLPAGASRWLHMDLPHKAEREFHLPVEWIEARSDSPSEQTKAKMDAPAVSMRNLRSPDIN